MNKDLKIKIDAYCWEHIDIHHTAKDLIPTKSILKFTKQDKAKIFKMCTNRKIFVILHVWKNFYNQGAEILTEMQKDLNNVNIIEYKIREKYQLLSILAESLKIEANQDKDYYWNKFLFVCETVKYGIQLIEFFLREYKKGNIIIF